jgi:DNA-binding IclR family transcriptional regulator
MSSGTDTGALREYAAPALDKGLDILELLASQGTPLTQREIAAQLGRSVGEIYRMLAGLVRRKYVFQIDDAYSITTKLFELAHENPPTHRMLVEAMPIMTAISSELDQSCHLSVYDQGRQVVIAKVDARSMSFSLRVGSELDVRLEEARRRRPNQIRPDTDEVLAAIRVKGYEAAESIQFRGVFAISYPVLDMRAHALAALTVPYTERLDTDVKTVDAVRLRLRKSAEELSIRVGGLDRSDEAA